MAVMEVENGYTPLMNVLIGVDQLFNTLLLGACDETLSSRTYRMARIKKGGWAAFEQAVNALFWLDVADGKGHCELSYLVEMQRGHMPKAMARDLLLR